MKMVTKSSFKVPQVVYNKEGKSLSVLAPLSEIVLLIPIKPRQPSIRVRYDAFYKEGYRFDKTKTIDLSELF